MSGTPCPARLHAISTHSQTDSAMDGASNVGNKNTASFRRKLVGRNCTDAISTRFPGFRLPPPLPNGNGYAALPIGARLNLHSSLTVTQIWQSPSGKAGHTLRCIQHRRAPLPTSIQHQGNCKAYPTEPKDPDSAQASLPQSSSRSSSSF